MEQKIYLCDSAMAKMLQSCKKGTVHSIFAGAVNLVFAGRIYTLLSGFGKENGWSEDYLGVPGSGYVTGGSFLPEQLRPGDTVKVEKPFLSVGKNLRWRWDETRMIEDKDFWVTNRPEKTADCLEKGIEQFRGLIGQFRKEKGIYGFYQSYFMDCLHETDRMQAILYQRTEHVVRWLLKKDRNVLEKPVLKLVGAGEGLTPSGDDFLCGLVLALESVGNETGKALSELVQREIKQAVEEKKTTDISRAMFEFLMEKKAPRLYCLLAEDFHEGGKKMEQLLAALNRVGHSSGIDMACGMASGFQIIKKGRDYVQ